MSLNDTPIQRKLTTIILLTCLVVVLLMGATFFTYEFFMFRQTAIRQLSTLGYVTAANSTAALVFDNHDDAREILTALSAEPQIVAASLYDQRGDIYAKFPSALPETSFPTHPGAGGYGFSGTSLSGFQPVVEGGAGNKRLGTLYLQFDTRPMIASWLKASLGGGAAVMAVVLLVAYLLSRSLQKQISRPILALADAARAVSERGDFSARAAKFGNDELGLLTDAFNQMLEKIQRQNETLRKNEAELERRVTERTTQLQRVNQELEAFSYSVSHDLRAPLRHVDGFAALLSKHAGASLDEKGRRYVTTISDAAKRMGRLIDDLLVFSRMSRCPVNLALVDQNALVKAILRDGMYEKDHPAITWEIADLPPVHADAALLRQVWCNLIDNAVKYSSKAANPRIEIGSLPSPDTAGDEPREKIFFVRDNGVGFDMKYADKLFGVFQRLHTVNEFEGTGIGLANVLRIVTRHGGRAWADGRVNEGATFYFAIPEGMTPPLEPALP
jgi:signal transduction histidine kinase